MWKDFDLFIHFIYKNLIVLFFSFAFIFRYRQFSLAEWKLFPTSTLNLFFAQPLIFLEATEKQEDEKKPNKKRKIEGKIWHTL